MSREIKFRAWDERTMFYPSQITFESCSWHVDKGRGVSIPSQPHITLMQFTGLHDKNGKEIYEGDICRLVNAEGYEHYENMAGIRAVEWNNENMALQFSGYVPLKWGGRESIEVIGNIYQNPELLK